MKCAHETALVKQLSLRISQISDRTNEYQVSETEASVEEARTNTNDQTLSCLSKLPRSVFPCVSEERALMNISKMSSGESVDDNIDIGVDDGVLCSTCEIDLKQGGNCFTHVEKRVLHTPHHGSIAYCVTDFTCSNCCLRIIYDALCHGVFRLNKHHLFSRELLDMWLWDICGTGGSFRDAYFSWSSKSYAATASLNRIGTDNFASRQMSNEAFNAV